ncbi:unnamed protein product [Mytilus edulis]|uniref:Uncharacterized protein n=1 Tax=Mytilus edulis TaxID=6550 RepID=A0A8S3R0T2_MYTED|nr:unnamed protein product [Mytilus edulis]
MRLRFLVLYSAIEASLTEMMSSRNFNRETSSESSTLHASITNFQFLITLVVVKNCMAFTRGLSTKLQGRTLDIVAAYKSVSVVKEALTDVRKTIDERFSEWFAETEELAKTVAVEPSIPRRCGRQTQRENCPADTPEIYYRRVIGIPYLDDVLSGMEARFSRLTSTAIQALKLVPAFVQSATFDEIKHFVDFYHTDLPSPSTMPSELRLWQKTCESMLSKPETVAGALKVCCKTDFPNISVILKS